MNNVVIVTDSSCDLPKETIDEYSIKVLPMPVTVKDNPEIDISHYSIKEFYDLMREGKFMPTTSQVVTPMYMKCFEEIINNGQVPLVIGLSSKLTGSYDSALLARENLNNKDIIVVDSKCASLGLGLVVLKAAQMAKEGINNHVIAEKIQNYALHMEHIFTVDSLDHLKRGGRISSAQAFVGGLLNIKPVLHFIDGAIHPLEKVRGRRTLVKRMVGIMAERVRNPENQVIGISHGDNEELAVELADAIKREFHIENIMISTIGPVIGSHTGPGTIALFFQNSDVLSTL